MALTNVVDPVTARAALAGWWARRHPSATDVEVGDVHVPKANGMSSETVLFTVTHTLGGTVHEEHLVARVAPVNDGLFPVYDLAREHAVMRAVRVSTGLPAPETHGVETDPSVLGAPFLLMRRCAGRVPGDDPPYTAAGWVRDLAEADQARLFTNALESMARIHTTDISTLDTVLTGGTGRGGDRLTQQIDYYERYYRWVCAGRHRHPIVERAFAWIHDNRPRDTSPVGLSWGDARIGNMMFGPDLAVTAILDWEMAAIGDAELDLAWFLFLNRTYSEGMSLPPIPGFGSREDTLERYSRLLGRPVRNIEFHDRFAALRATVIMMRVGIMMTEAGLVPAAAEMALSNPASTLLAADLGMADHAGAATWLANRGH